METIRMERRSQRRYPMSLDLRYKLLEDSQVVGRGCGKTRDLSSRGMSFQSDEQFRQGMLIRLSIEWPFLMEDACPVTLVVVGRVVRSAGSEVGVRIMSHDFRRHGLRRPCMANVAEPRSHPDDRSAENHAGELLM